MRTLATTLVRSGGMQCTCLETNATMLYFGVLNYIEPRILRANSRRNFPQELLLHILEPTRFVHGWQFDIGEISQHRLGVVDSHKAQGLVKCFLKVEMSKDIQGSGRVSIERY